MHQSMVYFVCMYLCKYVCISRFVFKCVCVHMYVHICMHMDMWIGMGMIVYIWMCLYMNMSTIIKLMDVPIIYLINTLYIALCLKLIHPYLIDIIIAIVVCLFHHQNIYFVVYIVSLTYLTFRFEIFEFYFILSVCGYVCTYVVWYICVCMYLCMYVCV